MSIPPPEPDEGELPVSSRRQEVLRALTDAHRPLTSAEIADALGVHKNTVRFHLESLLASGQVERAAQVRSGPGRPAQAFRAVRGMDPGGPRFYQLLAGVLSDALLADPDGPERATEAGRRWGHRLAATSADPITAVSEAVDQLVDLLDAYGFAPERDGGARRGGQGEPAVAAESDGGAHRDAAGTGGVAARPGERGEPVPPLSVRHCPFLELADAHQRIVCPVHLGLMRGALEAWGAPVQADALDPFVEPDRCLVHLSTTPQTQTGA
ncbi:helix-turn-helix transcriptional regulator [Ruania albidiflava]|uniref:helix-turn-helix transcriptional regulator n=1 Tax=Ruania albidiflava TaxID=366586 RepID=UPI0023F513B3|nr:helix-turn-helix domain-containing protein [Ruania albidiflava]